MGQCFAHTKYVVNDNVQGQGRVAAEVFYKLGIEGRELDLLYSAFCDIDVDESGTIRKAEFYAYFKINQSKLYDKIFGMFDVDGSGMLNFMEFVCSMWNFCSMLPEHLASFAFYLFDDDKSGVLDFNEVRKLIEVIHRKTVNSSPEIYNLVEKLKETYITMRDKDFAKCVREKPTILAPLLAMQFSLRGMLIGESYWAKLTERRLQHPEQQKHDFILGVEREAMAELAALEAKARHASAEEKRQGALQRIANKQAIKGDVEKVRNDKLLSFFRLGTAKPAKRTLPVEAPRFSTESYVDTEKNFLSKGKKSSSVSDEGDKRSPARDNRKKTQLSEGRKSHSGEVTSSAKSTARADEESDGTSEAVLKSRKKKSSKKKPDTVLPPVRVAVRGGRA